MHVKFKEFYLEVETTIPLWTVINVIRDTMGKNFIAVCSFSGIVHPISPSIKLRLKEWNKNPSEYKAGFLVKIKHCILKGLKTYMSSGAICIIPAISSAWGEDC